MTGPVQLCTDSSAQLPPQVAASLGVDIVPVGVALDGEPFEESELDVDLFYDRLRDGARATTSQPSPGRFAEAYGHAVARGAQQVLSIHVSGAVSGTVGSAELAAKAAEIPVTVVDTGTVSFGVAACVIAAQGVLAAGGSPGEAERAARRLAPTLRNVFVAARAPGGRVPSTPEVAVLSFMGASAVVLGPARSLEHAVDLLAARVLGAAGPITVAVGHADRATAAPADRLAETLAGFPHVARLMRYRVGPSVGAHTGPLSFGAFWWDADPTPLAA